MFYFYFVINLGNISLIYRYFSYIDSGKCLIMFIRVIDKVTIIFGFQNKRKTKFDIREFILLQNKSSSSLTSLVSWEGMVVVRLWIWAPDQLPPNASVARQCLSIVEGSSNSICNVVRSFCLCQPQLKVNLVEVQMKKKNCCIL